MGAFVRGRVIDEHEARWLVVLMDESRRRWAQTGQLDDEIPRRLLADLDRMARGSEPLSLDRSDEATVTTADAAELLGVTQRRVVAMLSAGALHGVKSGGKWAVFRDDVDCLIADRNRSVRGRYSDSEAS